VPYAVVIKDRDNRFAMVPLTALVCLNNWYSYVLHIQDEVVPPVVQCRDNTHQNGIDVRVPCKSTYPVHCHREGYMRWLLRLVHDIPWNRRILTIWQLSN
jgi:hypothetical protein